MLRGKMYKTPSYRLKFLMNLLKINIKEFSAKTGIPYRTIQSYLLKERQPNYENLQKIATHLCVNLNWLLTGEGEPFVKKEGQAQFDDITEKILILLRDRDEEKSCDVLKYIEEKKLLMELLEERKKKQAG
jgi:predicted transcriptional regulator